MTSPRPALLLAAALAVLGACRRDAGPADRYRAFAAAAREGKEDDVWAMLSERSRAELDRRAKDLAAKAPPGVLASSGRATLLGDLAAAAPRPASIVVVRESRDAAVVAVETEGEPGREVSLVREGGVWRVDVPFDK